ncbi:3'-5' exonuclease (plasmid) [Robbsia andropogonis]|uniref:3'-5' exonuclease n=1 Tax=Robbsia andropogonis TaxID=28092 RepID=UPI003D25D64E
MLRRTQTDSSAPEGLDDEFLDDLKERYKKCLTILVMSVHGSKGLEADFVIIPGLDSGFRGFPDDRPAEWLWDLVLPRITDPVEEERRLLYVGLTRARYRCTVLVSAERPSQFALELAANADTSPAIEWIRHDSQRVPCPRCQIGSLVLANTRTSKRVCTRRNSCGFRERPEPG